MGVSKTQIDRLGDRLKRGPIAKADLQLLDDYRRSFGDAHDAVLSTVRDRLGLQPTGRPAKSTPAIVDKLLRESIRLSQIQDIAGCRLVVSDVVEQDDVLTRLRAEFPNAHVVDRRLSPSHGYRAVHVVVDSTGKAVEVQVRSMWQQKWAEFSEKCADAFGPDIKYGGGHEGVREVLSRMSEVVSSVERIERVMKSHSSNQGLTTIAGDVQELRSELLSNFEQATAIVEVLQLRIAR